MMTGFQRRRGNLAPDGGIWPTIPSGEVPPMFHHVKDLQFNARVSGPDPQFARLLLEQFGGGNGELKAAMQYFTQAFCCRQAYPKQYDLLMDIATEEFSHLEIVGATIQMLLGPVNGELKDAVATHPVA